MNDSRAQVSGLLVGVVAASVLLSVVVAAGLSMSGTTSDLNLNEHSNVDVPNGPAISYAAVCVLGQSQGDDPGERSTVAAGLSTADVEITFSNAAEPGEFFTAEFTATQPIDYVVLKGGQRMEEFVFGDPTTDGTVTFGLGDVVDPARPNNAPCRVGDVGVK
ncbi:hypothetical protein [Salinigranum marinum]|uniref:hypothetical protein n=1 Tax=Salinigranum marinum TaxID=1515595 RepID=UPI002989AEC3|nr:hypothetical protein [Salinigranum marinum]